MPGVEVQAPVAVPMVEPAPLPPRCQKHSVGDQYMVLENGRFAYLSMPPQFSTVAMAAKLCVLDHRRDLRASWDPLALCCLQEVGHVHAHVHRGEITQDIFLEQCMEDAGCALPMLREMSGSFSKHVPNEIDHHKDTENCGHDLIAHGDHFDCLVPLRDGSYMLSHAQKNETGGSKFIEHGRLVKVGETLGKLKRRPKQLVDLFSYESPKRQGYESLRQGETSPRANHNEKKSKKKATDHSCKSKSRPVANPIQTQCCSGKEDAHHHDTKVTIPKTSKSTGLGKTTIDVMGICCPNEVPLIKKLLEPIPGVEEVSVNVTSKTVTVLHDQLSASAAQLVKALNDARMVASVHQRGQWKAGRKWPSPWTIASGLLLGVSFFQYLYNPLRWVALGSVGVGIPPLIIRSIAAMKSFILDINILMLIAVGGAIGLGDYLEAGSIAFLFTLADWLESRSSDKARAAIAAVVDLAPRSATLLSSGMRVRVEEVTVGTLLAVKAGEMVPIDGTVTSGKCNVDESSLTGESMPVEKDEGANVWAGTVNMSGHMTVKTTALAEDSAVSRMVRLVEEAQTQRSRTEMLVEQVAKYYTPGIVVAAIIIAVVPLALHIHQPRHWLYLALVLLVVACPCALVISTPVVTTCGIAQAAKLGLLVKGGSYLEVLGRLKVVALDKTGTLSEGHFRVTDVLGLDGGSNIHHILHWVASVENKASHPMASALVDFADLHGVKPAEHVTDFEVIVGEGVSATVNGRTIHIGNARMAHRLGWEKAVGKEIVDLWSSQGATVGWIGVDKVAVGVYGVADQLRTEAIEAVRNLKKLGIRVAMLTGDSASAASFAHKKLGDIEIHAQLLPEDKVHILQELKKSGTTAMVGDGINDAPALAAADVGIAMGVAGSAVAMETADVALMTNDLRKLAIAVELGRNCRWKIGQNVTLSFVTKIAIIALAASGYASLWTAVMADVGTCLLVIFNSMRLLKHKSCNDHCCTTTKVKRTTQQQLIHHLSAHGKGEKCCSKPAVNMVNLEGRLVDLCDDALSTGPLIHAHRGKFSWLKNHHHHGHSHHSHLNELDQRHENERLGYSSTTAKGHVAVTDSKVATSCCSSSTCEQGGGRQKGKDMHRDKERHSLHEEGDCGLKCVPGAHSLLPKLACSSSPDKGITSQEDLATRDQCLSESNEFLKDGKIRDKCGHDHSSIDYHSPHGHDEHRSALGCKIDHPCDEECKSSPRGFPLNESAWRDAGFTNLDINSPHEIQDPADVEMVREPTTEVSSPHGLAVLSSLGLQIFGAKRQACGPPELEFSPCTRVCCGSKLQPSLPNSAGIIDLDSLEGTNKVAKSPTPPITEDITKSNDMDTLTNLAPKALLPNLDAVSTSESPAADNTKSESLPETSPSAPLSTLEQDLINQFEKEATEELMKQFEKEATEEMMKQFEREATEELIQQFEQESTEELTKEFEKESTEELPKKLTLRHPVLKYSASDTDLPTLNSIRHPHPLDKPVP